MSEDTFLQPYNTSSKTQGAEPEDTERFRLRGILGKGGTSTVWLADDLELAQPVALKCLHAQFYNDHGLALLKREVTVARGLRHPYITRTYDLVWVGVWSIAMEYIDGISLRELNRRRLGCERDLPGAVELAIKICDAVAAAHQQGVAHGDIKPGNILIDDGNQPHLLDFGFTRRRKDLQGGTPLYSPPEACGLDLDKRGDVYSLGLVIHEHLTGELPIKAEGSVDSGGRPFLAPKGAPKISRELPSPLRRILATALEPRPEDRYPSAVELREALKACKYSRREPTRRLPRRRSAIALLALVLAGPIVSVRAPWFSAARGIRLDIFPPDCGGDQTIRHIGAALAVETALAAAHGRGEHIVFEDAAACWRGKPYRRGRGEDARIEIRGELHSDQNLLHARYCIVRVQPSTYECTPFISCPRSALALLHQKLLCSVKDLTPAGNISLSYLDENYSSGILESEQLLQGLFWRFNPNANVTELQGAVELLESKGLQGQSNMARNVIAELLLRIFNTTGEAKYLERAQQVIVDGATGGNVSASLLLTSHRALLALGRRSEAVGALDRAIAMAGDSETLHRTRGRYFDQLGLHSDALASYNLALRSNPSDERALGLIGSVQLETGQYEAAIDTFRRAVEFTESAASKNNLGAAYLMAGRLEEAQAEFNASLQQEPLPGSYYDLALVHFYNGNLALAIPLFERAVEMDRNLENAWHALAETWHVMGDEERARYACERGLAVIDSQMRTSSPTPRLLAHAAAYNRVLGHRDTASDYIRQGLKLDLSSTEVLVEQALLYASDDDPHVEGVLRQLLHQNYAWRLLEGHPTLRKHLRNLALRENTVPR